MNTDRRFILTKIIATVGPACAAPEQLVRLIEEGARVFRINFSHGSFDDFGRSLQAVRDASERTGTPVAVLGDLSGPKIRVGQVQDGGVELAVGDDVILQKQPTVGSRGQSDHETLLSTTFPAMIDDVQPGQRLLLDDGAVRLLVLAQEGQGEHRRLRARVTVGGLITSAKGINLPDTELNVPSITEYDWRCVQWAIENELDLLALSFVRKAADLEELKSHLKAKTPAGFEPPPVVAKIEKPQAIDDLENIVIAADALMVARGDLGVEMDLAEVPVIQKRIITVAHDYGKPVIVATQMLQSMIHAHGPTRAEVSDVANAMFDGADAVMLSGETAVGRYPVQAVNMMARIALTVQAQPGDDRGGRPPRRLRESRYRTAALAHGVSTVVQDLAAKLIVVWSQRGGGARYLSQNRANIPIIAASSSRAALRRMAPLFAVVPVYMDRPTDVECFVCDMDRLIQQNQWANPGDPVVIVAGAPIGIAGVTNKLRIHYVGDVCRIPT